VLVFAVCFYHWARALQKMWFRGRAQRLS